MTKKSSNKLGKNDRLRSKLVIDQLFSKGQSIFVHPLKFIYCPIDPDWATSVIKLGVSVPKRNFKKAVDRNLLKRRIREAYRTNKSDIVEHLESKGLYFAVMYIYVGKEIEDYRSIKSSVVRIHKRFLKAIHKKDEGV